jgi:hypothetical protein
VDFDALETVYRRYLHLDHDPTLLRIIYSIVLANRYDGSPLWAILLGPAGCGKSEILMSLDGSEEIVAVSTLTPYALASAHGPDGGGLLFELDGKCLVIEDLSAVSELPKEARGMLFSFLRSAYNGEFVRQTGKGKITWEGKFGLLAGATPAIERTRATEASLGERFLNIRMRVTDLDEEAMLDAVDANANKKSKIKKALATASSDFLEHVSFDPKKRTMSKSVLTEIRGLAIAVAKARTHVERDHYTKEVSSPVERGERATRVYLQLQLVACAARAIGADWDEVLTICQRLTLDSVPLPRLKALLAVHAGAPRLKEISAYVNMSGPYVQRTMDDLVMLGVMSRNKNKEYVIADDPLAVALADQQNGQGT